jgi:hypothetical protein
VSLRDRLPSIEIPQVTAQNAAIAAAGVAAVAAGAWWITRKSGGKSE